MRVGTTWQLAASCREPLPATELAQVVASATANGKKKKQNMFDVKSNKEMFEHVIKA